MTKQQAIDDSADGGDKGQKQPSGVRIPPYVIGVSVDLDSN